MNQIYLQINQILIGILNSTTKANNILSDSANEIYKKILQLPTNKGIDFGYGSSNPEAYDESISDSIERIANPDFEAGIMNCMKCFSNLIHANPRETDRIKSIYIAFALTFLITWIEKTKSVFLKIDMSGLKKKIDFLLDWYVDSLIVFARQKNVIEPVEGILFVKEIKESDLL